MSSIEARIAVAVARWADDVEAWRIAQTTADKLRYNGGVSALEVMKAVAVQDRCHADVTFDELRLMELAEEYSNETL